MSGGGRCCTRATAPPRSHRINADTAGCSRRRTSSSWSKRTGTGSSAGTTAASATDCSKARVPSSKAAKARARGYRSKTKIVDRRLVHVKRRGDPKGCTCRVTHHSAELPPVAIQGTGLQFSGPFPPACDSRTKGNRNLRRGRNTKYGRRAAGESVRPPVHHSTFGRRLCRDVALLRPSRSNSARGGRIWTR